MAEECIFCKIVAGEIPAEKVYEDDLVLGFRDIKPAAPTHVLLIPKAHIATINDLEAGHEELIGHLVRAAQIVARQEGLGSGYRLVLNCLTDGGQEVYHIHLHLLGGRRMKWPPG